MVARPRGGVWPRRVGLLFLSLAAGLLAAEGLARGLRPKAYAPVFFLTPAGDRVPISEIIHFLRYSPTADKAGEPRAWSPALLDLKLQYDRPRWSYFDAQGCIRVAHNSLGFRDEEFPVEKPAGELRVLALGDSFTYGTGVRAEDSWPEVLESLIAEGRPGGVQVINGGFAANTYHPAGYPAWMRAEGLRFDPDLVVVGLCLNDLSTAVPMLGYAVVNEDAFAGPCELLNRLRRTLEQRTLMSAPRDYADIVRHDPAQWGEAQAGLIELRDLLAEHEVGLVVAVLPMMSRLGDDCPYLGLHAMAAEFCAAAGIPCVDLLPEVRHRDERDLWVHPLDQHPNDVGQRLLAEGIYAFLAAQGLL
jgi:lysophospholipase L1-like esterase